MRFFSTMALRSAVTVVVLYGLLANAALANEDSVSESWLRDRGQDYQRLDPGVPVWPTTCDCIRYSFSQPGKDGKRVTRFSLGKADRYYAKDWSMSSRAKKPAPLVPMRDEARASR